MKRSARFFLWISLLSLPEIAFSYTVPMDRVARPDQNLRGAPAFCSVVARFLEETYEEHALPKGKRSFEPIVGWKFRADSKASIGQQAPCPSDEFVVVVRGGVRQKDPETGRSVFYYANTVPAVPRDQTVTLHLVRTPVNYENGSAIRNEWRVTDWATGMVVHE